MTPVEMVLWLVLGLLLLSMSAAVLPPLWRRRRWVRTVLPKVTPPPPLITPEQARQWRLQAVDEEHSYWDDRFRAAGGVPPLRREELARLERYAFAGSNSAFVGFRDRRLEQADIIREMRARLKDREAIVLRDLRVTTAAPFIDHVDHTDDSPPRPPRKEWRTPLRDLVDPAP